MKKKVLFISLGVSIAVIAAVAIPVGINLAKKNNSHKVEKTISFTFSDLYFQGVREEGGSYWEFDKHNGSPTGQYDFSTKREYDGNQWVYHSYVNGEDYDTIGSHIVTIYKDTSSDTPNTAFHFEFVLPPDATFVGADLIGHFYTDSDLTNQIEKISYTKESMKPLTIIESINEYYQLVLDEITFKYFDL